MFIYLTIQVIYLINKYNKYDLSLKDYFIIIIIIIKIRFMFLNKNILIFYFILLGTLNFININYNKYY